MININVIGYTLLTIAFCFMFDFRSFCFFLNIGYVYFFKQFMCDFHICVEIIMTGVN